MSHRAPGAPWARCYHAFVMSAATPGEIAMSKPLLAAVGLVALLFAAAASAQLYRWVDKDGKVHYTDTPPPAAAGKSAQVRSGGGNVADTSALPYATQQAVRNYPVTIYTHETCKELCAAGRKLLQSRGVPFREDVRAPLRRLSVAERSELLAWLG